jgi:hypothetical protein
MEFAKLEAQKKNFWASRLNLNLFDDNGTALLGPSDYEDATLYSAPTKAIKSILTCDNIASSHIIW